MSDQKPHDLHSFMAQITQEIASEYDRIFSKSSSDPGTAGDEGEENWATLLREWLPATYPVVTKGRIISYDGTMSPQIDVLVLKPSYPRKLREKKIWLAGGVVAAFECKTTITASHVVESVHRASRFKNLFSLVEGSPASELRSPLFYGLLAHSHSWKKPGSTPLVNITNAYEKSSLGVGHPRLLLDLICVADLATWHPMAMIFNRWQTEPDTSSILHAAFHGDWGVTTTMMCASHETERQSTTFTPVGAMIGFVTQRLARADPSIRELADYYRKSNLWGSGCGTIRKWPSTVYSPAVQQAIMQGKIVNGDLWDDWSLAII